MPDSISAVEQNEHPLGDLDTGECSSSAGEASWKQNTDFRVPLQSGVILNEHIFVVSWWLVPEYISTLKSQ